MSGITIFSAVGSAWKVGSATILFWTPCGLGGGTEFLAAQFLIAARIFFPRRGGFSMINGPRTHGFHRQPGTFPMFAVSHGSWQGLIDRFVSDCAVAARRSFLLVVSCPSRRTGLEEQGSYTLREIFFDRAQEWWHSHGAFASEQSGFKHRRHHRRLHLNPDLFHSDRPSCPSVPGIVKFPITSASFEGYQILAAMCLSQIERRRAKADSCPFGGRGAWRGSKNYRF